MTGNVAPTRRQHDIATNRPRHSFPHPCGGLISAPPYLLTVFGDYLALAADIVAFVMPPLIDAINRRHWASEVKAIFAFVWCFLASLLLVWVMERLQGAGQFTSEQWLRAFMIVFVGAIALQRWFWKPSGMSEAIDRATG